MHSSLGKHYAGTEWDALYTSRRGHGGDRGVLRFGGLNSTVLNEHTNLATQRTYRALTGRQHTVMHADWGGPARWGDSVARARATSGADYLQDPDGGAAAAGDILLLGESMGGATAIKWAAENTEIVGAIALGIPATNIDDIHDRNPSGLAASIEAAYGGNAAAWDAAEPTENPIHHAATLKAAGIPICVWSSQDDPICTRAAHEAFCAASGAELVDMGAVGHGIYDAYHREVAAFLAEHG